jgi:hypothetical protein
MGDLIIYMLFLEKNADRGSATTSRPVGAYFVAFTGKVTIYLKSDEYNVVSNPISLRVIPPEQIVESDLTSLLQPIAGYLTLNDFPQLTGRLNSYRLTGGPLLELRFRKRL